MNGAVCEWGEYHLPVEDGFVQLSMRVVDYYVDAVNLV